MSLASRLTVKKLSPSLKALIDAKWARPHPIPAGKQVRDALQRVIEDGQSRGVGSNVYLGALTASIVTLNSTDGIEQLFELVTREKQDCSDGQARVAEFMREVGLRCVTFNGVAPTINILSHIIKIISSDVRSRLKTTPWRNWNTISVEEVERQGLAHWKDIYNPYDRILLERLEQSHPDLPRHIINAHYGMILSCSNGPVGKVTTSVIAIACLRARPGVSKQLISHIHGLKKCCEINCQISESEIGKVGNWLAEDEGIEWLLKSVDSIVAAYNQPTPLNCVL